MQSEEPVERVLQDPFQVLEPKGTKWHWYSYVGMAGNYLLMMFYTTVAGWMISYFFKMLKDFVGKNPAQVENTFGTMLSDPKAQIFWMLSSYYIGIFSMFSWSSKWSREDHSSYDVMFVYRNSGIDRKECNFRWSLCRIKILSDPRFCSSGQGVMTVVSAAMGQAFFTLSLGIQERSQSLEVTLTRAED